MSAMQKIFNAIGMGPATPAAQAPNPAANQPANPGNIPAQNQNPASPNNPMVPAESITAMEPAKEQPKGLDSFNDMWTPPKEGEGPKEYKSAFAEVTPENVKAFADKQDFTKAITPELLSKISAGGEEGVAAMMSAMNAASKSVYEQSTANTMSLVEAALAKQREQMLEAMPGLMKQQNLSENLRSKNPIFDHPAAKPMLNMFMQQVALKNPTATVAEQTALAEKFLVDFAEAANPKKQTPEEKAKASSTKEDWSDFF